MAAFIRETWRAENTSQDYILKFGAVPIRDIDYKHVPWKFEGRRDYFV
jgi:hypothetical protein